MTHSSQRHSHHRTDVNAIGHRSNRSYPITTMIKSIEKRMLVPSANCPFSIAHCTIGRLQSRFSSTCERTFALQT